MRALSNGNYVVGSRLWDNGAFFDAGAVTWGDGTSGTSGVISATNSLVGNAANDWVGESVTVLSNGNYVIRSPRWDNGATGDGGAVTWGSGASGIFGSIDATNSVLGLVAGGGMSMNFSYDAFNWQLVVGRPAENIVTLFRLSHSHVFLPVVRK